MSKRILFITVASLFLLAAPASAKRLSVSVDKGNVRSGPGTDHEILWSVGKYYPVDILTESKGWYKISDFEGDVGWMHESLLKEIPCVIVKATLVNIRKGPGQNFNILFQAEKGVGLKRLGKEKGWVKVEHADGDVGWIHESLVWGE